MSKKRSLLSTADAVKGIKRAAAAKKEMEARQNTRSPSSSAITNVAGTTTSPRLSRRALYDQSMVAAEVAKRNVESREKEMIRRKARAVHDFDIGSNGLITFT